jgi:ribose transport system substrate-binding protein
VTAPHSKPAPKGLHIVYITCGLPTCTTISNSVKSAAETLGWKYTALGSKPTPEAIKTAWGQAVRLKPDAVLASGFPRSIFEPELQQLKKMGVGVFECCAPDAAKNGITMSVVQPDEEAVQGEYIAAVAAQFAKGTPNVLFVNLPEFAAIQPQYPAFVSKLEEYAPGAKQAKIDIPNTAIGTTSADRIVSYLRSHKDVNFVALSQDALSAGLPAAMKAAGLDVPFSGDGGGPQPRQLVASGQQTASVEFPIDQVFWTLVDGVVRWKNGESTEPDIKAVTPPPYFIVTQDNVKTTPESIVTGLKDQYAKLWGR